ncbi:unnamed protein product [Strongylus vulgaris]|uniref:Uncharacterized protein n=1 Tax=Strongylus vulgaris TaxID=40348 RepID=A0A3P7HY87_STRVU|nr:unnamed protein product [Strongylus vulgaris]
MLRSRSATTELTEDPHERIRRLNGQNGSNQTESNVNPMWFPYIQQNNGVGTQDAANAALMNYYTQQAMNAMLNNPAHPQTMPALNQFMNWNSLPPYNTSQPFRNVCPHCVKDVVGEFTDTFIDAFLKGIAGKMRALPSQQPCHHHRHLLEGIGVSSHSDSSATIPAYANAET